MEDIIDIIVTETTNLIEITSQPTDEIIDVNIIDNREDVTLNVTPTVVEININSLTSNFGVAWGDITGTLADQTDLQNVLNAKADLVDGKVPSSQLPSYVDDVVEVANYASLPATGEVGKIYITLDTNYIYRWTGSTYVEIKDSSAVWGAITGTLSNQTDLQNALNLKANDSLVVHLAGTETITGAKTFSSAVTAPNFVLSGGTGNTGLYYGHTDRVVLANYTVGGIDFEVNGGSIVATLFPSGNYGLGITLDAGYKLDVNGTARISGVLSGTSASFSSSVTASSIIKSGGTSSQFLKADGSVDSTSYQPLLTNPVTGTGTSGIVAVFNGTSSITDSTIYANSTRVSIGADVTTTNRFTAVSSTTSAYAVVAQASSAAHGIWSNVLGTGEIFRGQTAGGSYFIINNGGNAFLNGNLNVGDFASTSYRLNVVGTANFTGALSGTSATFTNSLHLDRTGVTAATPLRFTTAGTNDWFIGQSPLGTSTSDLFFYSYGTSSSVFTLAKSTGAATFSSSVTATQGIFSGSDAERVKMTRTSIGSWSLAISGSNRFSIYDVAGDAERISITSSGNVGIGTTSPGRKLQINVTPVPGEDEGINVYNGTTNFLFTRTASTYTYRGVAPLSGMIYSEQNISLLSDGGNVTFHTNGGERMRITSAGNVGIGTTSPSAPLSVSNAGGIGMETFVTVLPDSSAGSYLQTYNRSSSAFVTMGFNASEYRWFISNSERMRITSGGQVLIGQTAASGSTNGIYFRPGIESGFIVTNDIALQLGRLGSTGDIQSFYTGTTRVGTISVSGSATSYNTTSDYRLKQDLKSFNGLEVVNKIKTYDYEWKADNTRSFGVLAHELQEVLPYAVMGIKDGETMQGVDYSKIVPVLIQAIKDQQVQIEQLKNK